MSRRCNYRRTPDTDPCENWVADDLDHCRAGHPCPPVRPTESFSDVQTTMNPSGLALDDLAASSSEATVVSMSAASDGSYTAVVDMAEAAARAGVADHYRLFGGVAVVLHVERLGLVLPLRSTGDADCGVPPHVLRDGRLVDEIERLGYIQVKGNRWQKELDGGRTATTDLLIPAYTSRARDNRQIGNVVTTEVPGLAQAFLYPPVEVTTDFRLTTGKALRGTVLLPDAITMLHLKIGARRVRDEARDSTDLWHCLEVCHAEGIRKADVLGRSDGPTIVRGLSHEFVGTAPSLRQICEQVSEDAARHLTVRIQALLRDVVGI